MQDLPHRYQISTRAEATGHVTLTSPGLPPLHTASPVQFGGPGDQWSPETLLTAAVADCFVLTFRAAARVSRLPWTLLRCDVTGTLDRVGRATRFTGFDLVAHLDVPEGTSVELAHRTLERTEHACLISNSLKGPVRLHADVQVEEPAIPAFG